MKQSDLKDNQKLLIQAFKAQNQQAYDQSLQKLQLAGQNFIRMISKIEYNSQFYMKHMPLIKQQRQLISQKDYKQFMSKNQKVLCRNFQKNAYLALLMQQMQQKISKQQKKKWSSKEQSILQQMINRGCNMKELYHKFSRRSKQQIDQKYNQMMQKRDLMVQQKSNIKSNQIHDQNESLQSL